MLIEAQVREIITSNVTDGHAVWEEAKSPTLRIWALHHAKADAKSDGVSRIKGAFARQFDTIQWTDARFRQLLDATSVRDAAAMVQRWMSEVGTPAQPTAEAVLTASSTDLPAAAVKIAPSASHVEKPELVVLHVSTLDALDALIVTRQLQEFFTQVIPGGHSAFSLAIAVDGDQVETYQQAEAVFEQLVAAMPKDIAELTREHVTLVVPAREHFIPELEGVHPIGVVVGPQPWADSVLARVEPSHRDQVVVKYLPRDSDVPTGYMAKVGLAILDAIAIRVAMREAAAAGRPLDPAVAAKRNETNARQFPVSHDIETQLRAHR